MTISEVVSSIEKQNEESVIYAKWINGKFLPSSEAVLIKLSEGEEDLPTSEIAERHCPGFEYFLEVFLVKEMKDLQGSADYTSLEQQVDRIIHYAEFDA